MCTAATDAQTTHGARFLAICIDIATASTCAKLQRNRRTLQTQVHLQMCHVTRNSRHAGLSYTLFSICIVDRSGLIQETGASYQASTYTCFACATNRSGVHCRAAQVRCPNRSLDASMHACSLIANCGSWLQVRALSGLV